MTETIDSIPESAMKVEDNTDGDGNPVESENYVHFPVTDVVEWYTVKSGGTIIREQFISNNPSHPEDIPAGVKD